MVSFVVEGGWCCDAKATDNFRFIHHVMRGMAGQQSPAAQTLATLPHAPTYFVTDCAVNICSAHREQISPRSCALGYDMLLHGHASPQVARPSSSASTQRSGQCSPKHSGRSKGQLCSRDDRSCLGSCQLHGRSAPCSRTVCQPRLWCRRRSLLP
jgi:hypothetical protein